MEIVALRDFTAYPGGVKRAFKAGESIDNVSEDDAAAYVRNGVAKPVKQEKKREAQ